MQLTTHPQPLRTLTREHPRRQTISSPEHGVRRGLTGRHRPQTTYQLIPVTPENHRPVLKRGTQNRTRVPHINRLQQR
ncbi:hypothetical protein, partial [Streptomyces endocoffeicus]|uniref:hypothetical protein n=1 Tax=Streptomyces endocoffeicus TaxID=2898945 RepID=UPI001E394B56